MKKHICIIFMYTMLFPCLPTAAADSSVINSVVENNVKTVDSNQRINSPKDSEETDAPRIIKVPYINQDEIASGCEAVSATMLLQHHGYDVTAKEFTDEFLIKKDWTVESDGKIHAADPSSAYPGSPYIPSGYNCGFGCYAPALAKSLNIFLKAQNHKAVLTTGSSLTSIIDNYIKRDIPVLIWATMDMKPSRPGNKWLINYIDENSKYKVGDTFTWIAGEHCLVLVGYDENNYYFNDPYKNHGLIAYNKATVESRFNELGCQALVILKNETIFEALGVVNINQLP